MAPECDGPGPGAVDGGRDGEAAPALEEEAEADARDREARTPLHVAAAEQLRDRAEAVSHPRHHRMILNHANERRLVYDETREQVRLAGGQLQGHNGAAGVADDVGRGHVQAPNECAEINARGTLIVLEEAARAGVRKLIFSSSGAIYGDNPISRLIESMPANPKSPYAMTKFEAERYCHGFTGEGRLATVSLRYFNVFGPRQSPNGAYAAVIPKFAQQFIEHQSPLINGDGLYSRDFTFVDNVVQANLLSAFVDAPEALNEPSPRASRASTPRNTLPLRQPFK